MLLVCLLLALPAPDAALTAVINAAKPLRGRTEVSRADLGGLRSAVRAWLEARMPRTEGLREELRAAGLMGEEPGYVSRLEVGNRTIIAGLAVRCGSDDAVYLLGKPLREVPTESHPGEVTGIHQGDGLLMVARRAVQCSSFWNRLSYVVYREGVQVLVGRRPMWLGEWGYKVDLSRDEFTVRLQGPSIDSAELIRTHVLRYRIQNGKAVRVDPVALEPRDFVDEWLTQPWSAVHAWSAPGLQMWHRKFYSGEGVMGAFDDPRQCPRLPGHWQIGVDLSPDAYFLVRQTGEAFRMMAVSREPFTGCGP